MNVYFDLEFTGLHQYTSLISAGFVADDGRQLYAESTEYNLRQVTPWIQENVIKNLQLGELERTHDLPRMTIEENGLLDTILGKEYQIRRFFQDWIKRYEKVEMWGDVLPWDWMLFCELFDGEDPAERIPRNVYYIPFDIATLMKDRGIDPDISREAFSGVTGHVKHNALDDARVIKACYHKLMSIDKLYPVHCEHGYNGLCPICDASQVTK